MRNQNFFKKYSSVIYWTIFSVALLALIFIQYYGLVKFHYPVTPGDDSMNHWTMIQSIKSDGKGFFTILKNGGYPPLYDFVILKISALFQIKEMTAMLWFYPSIIVLASLSAYFLAYSIFGRNGALITFILYAFTALTPVQLLNDGGYPNLIAAHIFFPLALGFAIFGWKSAGGKKIVLYICASILAILVPFTHHLTTFELIGAVLLSAPVLIIAAWIGNKWELKRGLSYVATYLFCLIVIGLIFFATPIFSSAKELAKVMFRFTGEFPFIEPIGKAIGAALLPLSYYPTWIGRLIVIGGIIFIPFALINKKIRKKEVFYPALIIIVWMLMLLFGSQSNILSNPERLARDAAVPLAVLAGGLILFLSNSLKPKLIWSLFFILACLFLAYQPLKTRLENAFVYEPMVRITDADLSALSQLRGEKPGSVLINGWNFFVKPYLPGGWYLGHLAEFDFATQNILTNPNLPGSIENIRTYDYLYVIESQKGWAPEGVRFGFASNYKDNQNFELIGHFVSQTNEIYLFRVIK